MTLELATINPENQKTLANENPCEQVSQMEKPCLNCRINSVFMNASGAFNKKRAPCTFFEYCEFKFSLMSKLESPNFRPLFGARRQVLTHCVRNQSSGGQRRDLGRRGDLAPHPQ